MTAARRATVEAVVGWTALVAAALMALHNITAPLSPFDEGIVLSDAFLVLHGKTPVADFYTNYGPATFYALAGAWKAFGASIGVERLLGLVVALAVAALAGVLAGRLAGRRFLPLAAAGALASVAFLGDVPYAYFFAVAALLGFAVALATGEPSRARMIAAGACLGLVGCFRLDVFAYALAGTCALFVARSLRQRRVDARGAAAFALAMALPLAVVWAPIAWNSGIGRIAHDYAIDQLRWVMPARVLPLPHALSPALFAVALSLSTPLWAWLALRAGVSRRAVAIVLVVWLAMLPQLFGRSDVGHADMTVVPAIVLVACALARTAGRGWLAGLPAAAVVVAVAAASLSAEHGDPLPYAAARRAVVEFVSTHAAPDQPIFVGCTNHGQAISNDMDLYFLTGRVGGSRVMQFDAGHITRAEVQAAIVAELERSRPPVAILNHYCWWKEPNASARAGASLLDAYLHAHYRPERRVLPFLLLTRVDPAAVTM